MEPLHTHILLSTANHMSFNGSRLVVMLYAAHLHASPALIGVLAGSFGVISAFTAVGVGRWIDRIGPRKPMMLASLAITAGMVIAGTWHDLTALFIVCPLMGTFNSMFQIATQQTIGRYGAPGDRPANFSLQSLGISAATLIGPLAAGLSIDHLGHSATSTAWSSRACSSPIWPAVSSSVPPPGSMRTPSSRCRRRCAGACCAPSCRAACLRAMAQWEHGGGFSVDTSVRIEADDRAGRERLLRYCARPPFALERRRELDPERLLYDSAKLGPGRRDHLLLTPLELIDRMAALVPPPRIHRHHYLSFPRGRHEAGSGAPRVRARFRTRAGQNVGHVETGCRRRAIREIPLIFRKPTRNAHGHRIRALIGELSRR